MEEPKENHEFYSQTTTTTTTINKDVRISLDKTDVNISPVDQIDQDTKGID